MNARVFLGIVTFVPGAFCVAFLGIFISVFALGWKPPYELIRTLVLLHFTCLLLIVSLLIYYLRHVYQNRDLTAQEQTLWIAMLFFGNVVAMPIYWCRYLSAGDRSKDVPFRGEGEDQHSDERSSVPANNHAGGK
jgi:hypothetical protein